MYTHYTYTYTVTLCVSIIVIASVIIIIISSSSSIVIITHAAPPTSAIRARCGFVPFSTAVGETLDLLYRKCAKMCDRCHPRELRQPLPAPLGVHGAGPPVCLYRASLGGGSSRYGVLYFYVCVFLEYVVVFITSIV